MLRFYDDFKKSEQQAFRGLALLFVSLLNLVVAVLVVSYGLSAWQGFMAIQRDRNFEVVVNGEGKISAAPDVARITAAILSEAEFLQTAQKENSEKSQALTDYLKGSGIEEKDIRTSGYNVYPKYRPPQPCRVFPCPLESDDSRVIGYEIRNSYEINIRNLAKAGEILAGVVAFGANEVSGITFAIDQPEALKAEARKKAIDNAREKAERLAADLGKRLGKIVSFSESGFFPPPIPMPFVAKGGDFGGEAAPSVQPGENEIVVNVSITYEFK